MVTGSQVSAHYDHQARTYSRLIDSYRGLRDELDKTAARLQEQLTEARRQLAALYLNELGDAAFARVAKLTGFKGFERRDPRQAMEHERKVLQHSIAEIEASERFVRRDDLVGPAGTLTQELDNARTTLEPLEQDCQKFERIAGFTELVALHYDTPSFAGKWWQASYWKNWATGDRICKELGMKDFGDDVLPAYKRVAEPRNFMRDEVKRISSEIDAVHDLVRQRDEAQHRLANLESIYLGEAQDYLGEHLENADTALLEQWAAGEPDIVRAVQMGVRKLAGIAAKRQFVLEIANQGVPQLVSQLEQRRSKAFQKVSKFSMPKRTWATFPDSMINREFDQKAQALGAQREKVAKRVDVLVARENYAGFDLRNDQQLWWLYFMDSPPPRLAPGLFDYYQRRPNAQPVTDPDFVDMTEASTGEAMATAFASGDLEQGTYLS